MSFRSRPVLDRKHRPRWQDELRTQQLTVVAFALAIALAVGIFGAAAWSGYWESHFRPVAAVAGTTYDQSDLEQRQRILSAETIDQLTELQLQLGGPRDQVLQQQMESLSQAFSNLPATAAQSLVDGAVLRARAAEFGIEVSDEELDAAVTERMTHPELVRANLILVLPEETDDEAEADDGTDDGTDEEADDGTDDGPTDEQLAVARAAAEAARERVEDGEDFATVATEVSDDFTASSGGVIGAFGAGDVAYAEYFDALAEAEVGDLVGPIQTERGFAVLELTDRREASTEDALGTFLEEQNVERGAYRDRVREDLLLEAFREHFETEVATSPAPQRRVAQIFIASGAGGPPVPEVRARHILISPNPEGDPAEATDEQWDAALEEAQEVEQLLRAEEADWAEIAGERSDDPGSGARGGDLGWYDPAQSPFVEEFSAALAELDVGEISEPIRTQFGWHLIQKTAERDSPHEQAVQLVDELREDPDSFAEVAAQVSEDSTAVDGGEFGWVAPFLLNEELEDAVFALDEVGEISDPVETSSGITIYQLLEISESREIEEDRLVEIHVRGFQRWLDEVRTPVPVWMDPQYASSSADL